MWIKECCSGVFWRCIGTNISLLCVLSVSARILIPILTAREDERTGVFIHWEIMELQLALCIDGHPEEERSAEEQKHLDKDIQGSKTPLEPSFLGPWSTWSECTVFITAYITLCTTVQEALASTQMVQVHTWLLGWCVKSLKMAQMFHHQHQ